MRISVLSNVNLDMLSGLLKNENEIFQTDGYGKWVTYALNKDEKLAGFAPEALVLILEGNALLSGCADSDSMKTELDHAYGYACKLAELYKGSYLLVSSIDVSPRTVGGKDMPDQSLAAAAYWELLLGRMTENRRNVHRLELKQLIENYGRNQFYSAKFWYMGSIPYEMKALHTLAGEIQKVLQKLQTVRKKVLVLDLDNTLWGGVIGEDGVDGILLDAAHEGAIYQDAQKEIKRMQQQGVLLAIASKNNPEDVQQAFRENPHMILKEEDFVAVCANWNPKPENVAALAKGLNLGLDSFVFVDDNEAERKAMEISLPEVAVAEFPTDITRLPAAMRQIYDRYFWSFQMTEEDREKTAQYRMEKLRHQERETAVSYEDYLKSLNTKIRLTQWKPEFGERAVQLMNKTNQFNTCTLRMDEPQLKQYLEEKQGHLVMAEVSDKYGSSGWVSEFLYHVEGSRAIVDNFIMSCRVMGRQIEDEILNAVFLKLAQQGVTEVLASYKKTAKNKPVEELWDRFGFTQTRATEEEKEYHINLTDCGTGHKQAQIHTVLWEE